MKKAVSVRRTQALFDDIEGRYAAGGTDFRAETSVCNALINCMWGISYCILLYFTALLIDIKLFRCSITVSWAKSGNRTALHCVTQKLSLMEELGLKGGDSDVQHISRTYQRNIRHSLNHLKYSNKWKVRFCCFPILECVRLCEPTWTSFYQFKDFYSEGYDSVRPCTRAYSIVLSTIARSHRETRH